MKILKRNIISLQEAEKLIERYYEGETSVAEENLLREYLSGKNVPAQFEAEKAIFGYFKSEKEKKNVRVLSKTLKWVASVAAVAAVFITVLLINQPSATSYAYVDGKKITNKKEILTLAQTTIDNLKPEIDEVEKGLENIQSGQVIETQLDVFAGVDF
ncbi:MAG TPA: hypothetical protein PLH70_06905 [Bacteroidales bacterium]|nr:hypothetical protein [Bacteroidales bacterium]HPZ03817.1 hypothetical protein [Bacteroidales bacterium]HQB75509.1 hypothetical protein [Bacteroidales bacterium]